MEIELIGVPSLQEFQFFLNKFIHETCRMVTGFEVHVTEGGDLCTGIQFEFAPPIIINQIPLVQVLECVGESSNADGKDSLLGILDDSGQTLLARGDVIINNKRMHVAAVVPDDKLTCGIHGKPKSDYVEDQWAKGAVPEGPRFVTVWYGTNRSETHLEGKAQYTAKRSRRLGFGKCIVSIPRTHIFGSTGSSWWKRLRSGVDDRLLLKETTPLEEGPFWEDLKSVLAACPNDERQAVIYIHGYNVSFQDAAIRSAQIFADLKVPGVMAFFSWPSKGKVWAYTHDEATIDASEAALYDFLCGFASRSGATSVHVVAHSMGNRGFARALQRVKSSVEENTPLKFGQIFLAAPDMDSDLFENLAHLYPALSERTTMYVSQRDKAVGLSKWFHGYRRVGFAPPVTVVDGVDTVEVPDFDIDFLGHSYFANAAAILHDMFVIVRQNCNPAKRQRIAPQCNDAGKTYWRLGV